MSGWRLDKNKLFMDHLRCATSGTSTQQTPVYGQKCHKRQTTLLSCVCVTCTHMTLEGREVNVGYEKDRLGLHVGHHLEDGHIVAFLEHRQFDIRNWEQKIYNRV